MQMHNEVTTRETALKYARLLQAQLCCYATKEGDEQRCSCEYLLEDGTRSHGTDMSGCCEACALIHYLERQPPPAVKRMADDLRRIATEMEEK